MTTTEFTFVVGVNAGYGHANQQIGNLVAAAWQVVAAKVLNDRGYYAAGVVTPGVAVYHTEWGCPRGGEHVATVVGLRNPHYVPDEHHADWRLAVELTAHAVATDFGQTTAYLTFREVEFDYLQLKPRS